MTPPYAHHGRRYRLPELKTEPVPADQINLYVHCDGCGVMDYADLILLTDFVIALRCRRCDHPIELPRRRRVE